MTSSEPAPPDLRIHYITPSVTRLLPGTEADCLGLNAIEMVAPASRKTAQRAFQEAISSALDADNTDTPVTRTIELQLIRKDGTTIWAEIHASIIRDSHAKPAEVIGVARDITDRKRKDAILRASEDRYRTLSDNVGLGVILIDTEHNILMTNAFITQLFGKSPGQLVGKKCYEELEKRDHVCPHCPGVIAMKTGQPAEAETHAVLENGTLTPVRNRAFPVYDSETAQLSGFTETVEDVTERKRAETALIRVSADAEARAQELDKVNRRLTRTIAEKEDFLRAVSHDLSAPLRNIAGMISFLKNRYADKFDHVGHDRLQRILRSVSLQNDLISELLELSRIRSKRGRFTQTPLESLVRTVVDQFTFDFESNNGNVSVNGDFPVIWCEPNRIRQVFQNLLDNAIKYAHPERPISVNITCQHLDNAFQFTIRDNGIGIAPENTEKISYVFRRLRNPTTAHTDGKGVGLASVRSIVEMYGGEIRVESDEGQGSSFIFTLPESVTNPPTANPGGNEPPSTDLQHDEPQLLACQPTDSA